MSARIARPLSLLLLLTGLATAGCVNAPPETRHPRQDAIRFESRSGIAKANGIFHDWWVVDSRVDPGDLARSYVEIEIDVASLDTAFPRRDDHLLEAEFFDAERWPKARVRVSDVAATDEPDHYTARFAVEIRDRKAEVVGAFQQLSERPRVVEGDVLLDRVAFGVGAPDQWWNPMSPRNEVPVHFRLTLE